MITEARDCVLVVDDEEVIDELIQEMLREDGFCEVSHMDPEAALAHFEKDHQRLGLAIVDLTMPKMTGVELAQRFLQIDHEVSVILITGQLVLPFEALTIPNVKTILAKPFKRQELREVLATFVRTQENEKEEREKRRHERDGMTWHFALYVSGGETRLSAKAIEDLNDICKEYLDGGCSIRVVDIDKEPLMGLQRGIVADPSLLRELPEPVIREMGDLSLREQALVTLEITK
jgi:circadian clock protein KaiB